VQREAAAGRDRRARAGAGAFWIAAPLCQLEPMATNHWITRETRMLEQRAADGWTNVIS
jgi:hypothetical protein